MEAVFLKILNMSITASYLVLAVVLARLLLKKAPKFIAVILWGLVALRLVCPFSFESVLSLIPSAETVPADIMYAETPQIYSGISSVNTVVNNVVMPQFYPDRVYSANPLQIWVFVASVVWVVGIIAMLLYTLISYARIRFKVREAVKLEGDLYECDRIASPFILGVIKPKIYLPSDMAECDREYVVAHEHAHIKRRDYLWKPLGFLLLAVYWFNPVLWVAYILLCRDIELACDEKVIKEMGEQNKKPYSEALINCSVPRKMIAACPLAFGETGVKARIKSVLNYKKPAFWVIIIAVVLSIAVAVCFMTNPLATEIVNLKGDIDYNEILSDADAITVIKGDVQYSVSYEVDIAEIIEQLKKVKVNKEPLSSSNDKFTNGIIIDRYSLWFSEDFSEFCGKDVISSYWPQSYKVTNPKAAEKVFDIISNSESNRINTNLAVNNIQTGSDIPGLSISVKQISLNVDKPYIEVEFNNQNDQEYTYGERFSFFYEQNGEWNSCLTFKSTETRKRVFTLQAIIIEPKGTSTKKYSLGWYDLSKEGKYRFETQVSSWNTWVEFELNNQSSAANADTTTEDSYIQFYDKPTDENQTPVIKKQVIFNSSDFTKLLGLLKNTKWVDDRKVDRLAHNYDGRIFYGGKWIYFGYSQNIICYDTYFCSVDTQILEIIAKYENSALIYGTTVEQLEYLREEYSDYFGLDTSNGLELYVSEFAEGQYKCELFSVSDYNFTHSAFDINTENGATLEEMKIILSSYDISSDKLYVLPYRNSLSSYYYAIDDEYCEKLKLLFGSTVTHDPYDPKKAETKIVNNDALSFNATVLKVYDNSVLLVEPFDYEEEYKSADQIAVIVENIVKYGSASLEEGDKVRIVYDGIILESYPAQIKAEAAYLLDDDEE